MATITIKNVPDDLYADLKQVAASNRRSKLQNTMALYIRQKNISVSLFQFTTN